MAKKLIGTIHINAYDTEKNTTEHHIKIEGDVDTLSNSLTVAALHSEGFENAIILAQLQIRETKAAQNS